jgi:hypothetical protein
MATLNHQLSGSLNRLQEKPEQKKWVRLEAPHMTDDEDSTDDDVHHTQCYLCQPVDDLGDEDRGWGVEKRLCELGSYFNLFLSYYNQFETYFNRVPYLHLFCLVVILVLLVNSVYVEFAYIHELISVFLKRN